MTEALGVLLVVLVVAAGRHVEQDAAFAFLGFAVIEELDAQLSFADASGAQNDGQSSRQQPAAEAGIEFGDSGLNAV